MQKSKINEYYEYCTANAESDASLFYSGLAKLWDITVDTVLLICYAEHRPWFTPMMINELIRLDKEELPMPSLEDGEFIWDMEKNRFKESVTIPAIIDCARCGTTHKSIRFEKLERQSGDYTHWSPCPVNKQPILLKIQA